MRFLRGLSWQRGLIWFAVFSAAGLVGGTVFIASGLYNVSASVKHFSVVEELIEFTLHRSIAFHADGSPPDNLDDDELVRLGALHFERGCAFCHGAPGNLPGPVVQEMSPAPPSLTHAASTFDPDELAWIIENGLKYTGMPAWAGRGREDEVWPIVSFLRRLPELGPDEYSQLVISRESGAQRNEALCVSCHGNAQQTPVAPQVPSLSGQTSAYLERALKEYRSGLRESGIMEPLAAGMDDEAISHIAAHFAKQPRPPLQKNDSPSGRGRAIAVTGAPESKLPACLACHGAGASENFPRLNGLSRDYIVQQLSLFKSGLRGQSGYGAVMETIARRLSAEQIEDVAEYFSLTEMDQHASSLEPESEP